MLRGLNGQWWGGGGGTPDVPAGVTANTSSASAILVSWNFTANAAYFDVYRSATQGGTYAKINSSNVTALSYSDTGRSPNTQYYYKVKAVDSAGLNPSAFSDYAYATTLAGTVTAQTIKTVTLASVVSLTGKPTYFPLAHGSFFDARFHPIAHSEENFAYYHDDIVNNSAQIMVPRQ
jgi:hypothetical protein